MLQETRLPPSSIALVQSVVANGSPEWCSMSLKPTLEIVAPAGKSTVSAPIASTELTLRTAISQCQTPGDGKVTLRATMKRCLGTEG